MGLANLIATKFKNTKQFTLQEAYREIPDKPKETIRARIYENIGNKFEKITKGIYRSIINETECLIIEANGRDLSMIKDKSIECIFTDHPWLDKKSNKGGSRSFANYECFTYEQKDFDEKARVLKDGCFLVEILPAENENNYEYLFHLKQMAKKAGLLYYAKVAWKKGSFVSNTGRKAKNTQDVMIFSKGKARNMRYDAKRSQKENHPVYMSGAAEMLPAIFDFNPVKRNEKNHQSELPVKLCEKIINLFTYKGETILDSFAGSGAIGEAALNTGRNCILIEILKENIEKICNRLKAKTNSTTQQALFA